MSQAFETQMRSAVGAFTFIHTRQPHLLQDLPYKHTRGGELLDDMSFMEPPPGFIDLATAQIAPKNSIVSVIGVVVDCLPPKTTKGSDVSMVFKLQDPRLRDRSYSGEGLKARFFSSQEDKLPPVKAKGDIVLLRDIRVSEYANETLLISNTKTEHLVFSASLVPSTALKLEFVTGNSKLLCQGTYDRNKLNTKEQDYIITVKSEMSIPVQAINPIPAPVVLNKNGPRGPGNQAAPTGRAGALSRKFRLVKDLQHRVFSDVCVEVVKQFTNNYGNCELYVTDYTANDKMFYYAPPEEKPSDLVRDGDRFGYSGPSKQQWPGPYGFLILKVNLTEPHASYASHNIREGDMITMQNVKMKLMPDSSRLEGDMWPDQNNPSNVQVRKLPNSRREVEELRMRKEEYWAARLEKAQRAEQQAESGLNKKQKKKLKREKRVEEERLQAEKEAAAAEK